MPISVQHLESKIRLLNENTGNPVEPYTVTKPLELPKHNVGHYCLVQQYGCFALHQIANEQGAEHDIFYGATKRELYKQISAMIDGFGLGVVLSTMISTIAPIFFD